MFQVALGGLRAGSGFRRAFGKWLSQSFPKRPQEGFTGSGVFQLASEWLPASQEGFPGSGFRKASRVFASGLRRASQEVFFFNSFPRSGFPGTGFQKAPNVFSKWHQEGFPGSVLRDVFFF